MQPCCRRPEPARARCLADRRCRLLVATGRSAPSGLTPSCRAVDQLSTFMRELGMTKLVKAIYSWLFTYIR